MINLSNLASGYAAAWTAHDAFVLAAHFEPTGHLVVNGEAATSPKAIADVAEGFFTLLPDLHYMADDTRTAGQEMLQSWTLYGHHKDTNIFTKLSGWTTWDVSKGGKIQIAQMFFDSNELG